MSDNIEEKLLFEGGVDGYEEILNEKIKAEISEAQRKREELLAENKKFITDIKKVSPEKKFDINTIYKVFNRKQKTETYVSGMQAEYLIKYTDDYIVRFHHRIEYQLLIAVFSNYFCVYGFYNNLSGVYL